MKRPPSSAADRQRRRRARQRQGRRVYAIEIDEIACEGALSALGYLAPLRADDPDEVSRALGALLERLFERVTRDADDR